MNTNELTSEQEVEQTETQYQARLDANDAAREAAAEAKALGITDDNVLQEIVAYARQDAYNDSILQICRETITKIKAMAKADGVRLMKDQMIGLFVQSITEKA